MERGLIREDEIPNYPEYLVFGSGEPEPLESCTMHDTIRILQRELEQLRKENNQLKMELRDKKLIQVN